MAGLEATGTTLKVQAVDDLKAQHRLPLLLHLAKLPRSTFYDHPNGLTQPDRHAQIKEAIRLVFAQAPGAYGHRRVLAILLRQGWTVSKKTVLKLMRPLGSQSPVRRRRRYNSYRGEVGKAAKNVLNRQFETATQHTKWATDVTEFTVGPSTVYVSPVLDSAPPIVIRSDSERRRAEITTDLMRDGSVLLDVSGLQNNRVTASPSSAGTTAEPHDSARFGVTDSVFHRLIIVSPCSVLWRRGPGTFLVFSSLPIATPKSSGVAGPPDAKPMKWLTLRRSLTSRVL